MASRSSRTGARASPAPGARQRLDIEISAYRKLLEQEESRHGLSQSIDDRDLTDGGRGEGRGTKRRRMMESEEYTGVNITTTFTQPGALLIEPLEENMKCVKVENNLLTTLYMNF